MTQQTDHDPGAITSGLRMKLEQLAATLTTEERAQIALVITECSIDALSPSLREKVEQAGASLTPEECAEVSLLAQRAGAVAEHAADVAGHMTNLYGEDGRPREAQDVKRSVPGSVAGTVAVGVAVGVGVVVGGFTFGAAAGAAGGAGLGLGVL
jgi:hypothetical protein